jgi:hypothetical protein
MKKQMEKNIFEDQTAERPVRKSVQFTTHLIVGDNRYIGNIINISTTGVAMYVNTHFPEKTVDCKKGEILTLELQSPLGKSIKLKCKIRWLRFKHYSEGLTTSMGMEIINPPADFINLFNSLK